MEFSHLHCHTQYSLLDGAAHIQSLIKNVKNNGMKAIAITDHGNMFGVPEFVNEANKEHIIPIIGCEFYLARGSRLDKIKNDEQDEKNIYHQLILAKNQKGYKNLSKLCSAGYIDGFYYKPRIDKELIRKHSEGLIATTCCIASEINQTILKKGEAEGELLFKEWLDIFEEDYYIELQRHGIKEQDICNEVLIKWSKKYNVKMIATNDVHYINMRDSEAQDILLCLQTGKDMDDPKRMRFENNQFYLKTKEEMEKLFEDVPEAIDNTNEIISKIEPPKITHDIILPIYSLPEGFTNEDEYLKHLSYLGAKQKYSEINDAVLSRLEYELAVIKKMGYAGYFLIVQDFISAAKKLGVAVGPGRGSATGSLIAYCTGITNIDPLKYNLIFERFLNPDRQSMPDIDIDFDDEGRGKVIDYVVKKYGEEKVAQIITFGTMAAKSSIKDVARVLKLPLTDANRLAKLVPDKPGTILKNALKEVKELAEEKKSKNILIAKTLNFAEVLEGSARHTGIHAAGIIISPDDLREHIPLCKTKDSDLLVTQYEGSFVEKAGMLKMDFLGLKTLSIIKDAVDLIELQHKMKIDVDNIPLDDKKTFELYQKADTIGTFQFESEGMRMYLKELKPTEIEDLIAMNALYRPGPMESIPVYIDRKHGRKPARAAHPLIEDILKPTYGVITYQEQVMQIAQVMGGFSMASADSLRRAMGKKDMKVMEEQKEIFVRGAVGKGVDPKIAEDIFAAMAKFGEYGFNRSHSAGYAILAYQTAYLKANYMAEYMAAVLTHNMNDVDKIYFFLSEAKHLGIIALGPDINESDAKFTVNKKGEIRFGLTAIKGLGDAAVEELVKVRNENGSYKNIFDLMRRVNLRTVNKKSLESLVMGGAFDSFNGMHRAQYFGVYPNENISVIERAIKYGTIYQSTANGNQSSLFGGTSSANIDEPIIPIIPEWSMIEQLHKEKEVTGIYISGHPLDSYKLEMEYFCNCNIAMMDNYKNKPVSIAGIVTKSQHRLTKNGANKFGLFTIENLEGTLDLALFQEDYMKYKHLLEPNEMLFIKGTYQLRFKSDDVFDLKVSSMCLLSEVRQKMSKGLTLNVPLSEVSDNMVEKLEKICKKYPGKFDLHLNVVDTVENYSVSMFPIKLKIDLSNELLNNLNKVSSLQYKLN